VVVAEGESFFNNLKRKKPRDRGEKGSKITRSSTRGKRDRVFSGWTVEERGGYGNFNREGRKSISSSLKVQSEGKKCCPIIS